MSEQDTQTTDAEHELDPITPGEVDAKSTFDLESTFADLGLSKELVKSLEARGFEHPTLIQSRLIPPAIAGRDVLGQARTGTGKTAAFGLPIIEKLKRGDSFAALILVPTRELAIQVTEELRDFARFTDLRVTAVYGGQRIQAQKEKLDKGPEIIVGTPGRVMDMHQRGMLPYDRIQFAILDEVDRMLDIGFRDDIRKILGAIGRKHQTIFVSATISDEIEKLARSYMRDPEKIVTTGRSLTVQQVRQSYVTVERWDKSRLLVHLLKAEEPALTLVFCRTKRTVDDVQRRLSRAGIEAHAIHGDMVQGKRNRVIRELRDGSLSVLVCSDLAARGLDVENITHVINYDLPEDPEVYVHRIGRTARAGREGVAWSFVPPDQGHLLTAVEMLANVEIPQSTYPDFKPGPVPADIVAHRELEKTREEKSATRKSRDASVESIDAADAAKFPGGIVPSKMPPKRMGGRLRSGRR